MGQPQRLNITLSDDAIEFVRSKVSSGEFASESDVIHKGLEFLQNESEERDRWEREVMIPAHDRLMANPSSAVPLDIVEQTLQTRRNRRSEVS